MQAIKVSRVRNVYAAIDFGQESIRLSKGKEPYGVNWAVRTNEQKKYLYDPNLGPAPGRNILHEEINVIRRMFADGLKGRWIPKALIIHYIPENRQTIKYIRKYHKGQGEYKALQLYGSNKCPSYEEKFVLTKKIIKSKQKYWIYRLRNKNPEIWLNAFINSCQARGQLKKKI